jgi:anti-sigma factor RsiW
MSRSTSNHAGHDELLLARLFGGDVDERERALAADLIASCPDCAAFYADLGAIKAATAALPVPPRPRDFTLTEADAARLRPARKGWLAGWASRSRLLGSSMAALGAAGIIFVGTFSAFAPSAARLGGSQDRGPVFAAATAAPAQPDTGQENGSQGSLSVPMPTTAAAPTAAPTAAATSGPLTVGPTPVATTEPSPAARTPAPSSGQGQVAMASPGPSGSPESASDTLGKGAAVATEGTTPPSLGSGSTSGGQPDARALIVAGCAVLLAAGLLLLIVPSLFSRRRRASR